MPLRSITMVHVAPFDPELGGTPSATGKDGAALAEQPETKGIWSAERFFTSPLLKLGHTGVNPDKPDTMYMDDHTVRTRGGLLHICSVVAFMFVHFLRTPAIAYTLYPLLCWEFLAAGVFGLTPLAPVGGLASIITPIFHPKPLWKPAAPKRFAWAIGFVLVNLCFVGYMLEIDALMYIAVASCYVATWLESVLGFCLGCFMYNHALMPLMERFGNKAADRCDECKDGVCAVSPGRPGPFGSGSDTSFDESQHAKLEV